jgi:selT/selW/selH-like putative selenoprotein
LAELLKKQGFDAITLVASSGGAFEVFADGVLLFSKLRHHRFPDDIEVIDLIKNRI